MLNTSGAIAFPCAEEDYRELQRGEV